MAKDFFHDVDKRLCGIYEDSAAGYVFFRSMQSRKEFLFFWFSAPVSRVSSHAFIKPPIQCVKIVDLKNKNAIQ